MQVYLLQNGQQTGPYNAEQIREMVFSCQISENDLGWHESLSDWQPLNSFIAFDSPLLTLPPPPLPIAPPPFRSAKTQRLQPQAPSVSSAPIACPTCGSPKWRASDSCNVCAQALAAATNRSYQPSPPTGKKIIKTGAWCPHCGHRNSVKVESGAGCLFAGILLISCLGILLIPFLPKSWKCKECGHQWK